VPALWSYRVSVPELAVRAGRTRRLWRPTPDASPPEYGAAPTGGFFGIGAASPDYRMTTGRWDRGRAVGGNILTRLRVIR
jgi:hypothetical protein